MTDTDDLISIHGKNFSVNTVSDGAADSYGDLAPTWSLAATEKVWLQDPNILVQRPKILDGIVGKMDDRDFVAYILSTSVITQGNVIVDPDSVRYDVKRVWTASLFGNVSHKIALVRKSEDA